MKTVINLSIITHPNSNKQKKEIKTTVKPLTSLKDNKAQRYLIALEEYI